MVCMPGPILFRVECIDPQTGEPLQRDKDGELVWTGV